MSGDKRFVMAGPCSSCPFSRKCTPGALGGSDAMVYVGQAIGPFLLPCHMQGEYDDKFIGMKVFGLEMAATQCAGAAIFRSNIGIAPLMPPDIMRLDADDSVVFATPEEFLAFHRGCSVEAARDEIRDRGGYAEILATEMTKAKILRR